MSSPFLAFTEVDRESGGGLILLTASLSGESVRHDWSRECRFFFSSLKIRGSVFFTLFSFFKLLSICFFFFTSFLSFYLSFFHIFIYFVVLFLFFLLQFNGWPTCFLKMFEFIFLFNLFNKSIFVVKNIFRKKWVSIYIVFNYIDCFMIYPFNLYLQLQNISKYLGKIPQ